MTLKIFYNVCIFALRGIIALFLYCLGRRDSKSLIIDIALEGYFASVQNTLELFFGPILKFGWSKKYVGSSAIPLPQINVFGTIDVKSSLVQNHILQYNKLCNAPNLLMTWPQAYVGQWMISLLSHPKFPFPLLGSVAVRRFTF